MRQAAESLGCQLGCTNEGNTEDKFFRRIYVIRLYAHSITSDILATTFVKLNILIFLYAFIYKVNVIN